MDNNTLVLPVFEGPGSSLAPVEVEFRDGIVVLSEADSWDFVRLSFKQVLELARIIKERSVQGS